MRPIRGYKCFRFPARPTGRRPIILKATDSADCKTTVGDQYRADDKAGLVRRQKSTAAAISSGRPSRRMGNRLLASSRDVPWLSSQRMNTSFGISKPAAATALKLMFSAPTCSAADLVRPITPPLVAAYSPLSAASVASLLFVQEIAEDGYLHLREKPLYPHEKTASQCNYSVSTRTSPNFRKS